MSPSRTVHLAAVAVQLLTRIPVRPGSVDDEDLRASVVFFPAVGVVVAVAGIAVRAAATPLLGPWTATILAVAATILVTGAFHEDGLADSADGLWGGWTPAQRLEIMKDSRLGTYGATALLLSLSLRISLLAPLDLEQFAAAEVAAHVLGRAAGVALAASIPAAEERGLGAKVIGPTGRATTVVVGASSVAAAIVGGGRWGWILLVAAGVAVWLMRSIARRRLGGVSGDLLGAVNQIAYLAVVAAVVALERSGWR